MALPKVHRLKRRQEFSRVYQSGTRHTSAHLTLRVLRQRGGKAIDAIPPRFVPAKADPTRIGISISQKVSKRAVVRNRIKRQIRAAIRQLLPQISAGWMVAIVVKPSATQCDYEQFLQELKQLLINAEVMDGY